MVKIRSLIFSGDNKRNRFIGKFLKKEDILSADASSLTFYTDDSLNLRVDKYFRDEEEKKLDRDWKKNKYWIIPMMIFMFLALVWVILDIFNVL